MSGKAASSGSAAGSLEAAPTQGYNVAIAEIRLLGSLYGKSAEALALS